MPFLIKVLYFASIRPRLITKEVFSRDRSFLQPSCSIYLIYQAHDIGASAQPVFALAVMTRSSLIIPLLGVLGINTYYHNVCVDKKCFHQPKDFSHCTLIPSQSKLDFLFLPLQGHQINQQNPVLRPVHVLLSRFYLDFILILSG